MISCQVSDSGTTAVGFKYPPPFAAFEKCLKPNHSAN